MSNGVLWETYCHFRRKSCETLKQKWVKVYLHICVAENLLVVIVS